MLLLSALVLLSTMVLLLPSMMLLLPAVMLLTTARVSRRRWIRRTSTLEIDVDSTFVCFGIVLESEFLTDLFDARFDLLDVVYGVVALADDAKSSCSVSFSHCAFSAIIPVREDVIGKHTHANASAPALSQS